eukprot:10054613-Alexandrium_andersonii.AAC.1
MRELGSQAVQSTRTHAGHVIHWRECSVCGVQIRMGKDIWRAMCSGAADAEQGSSSARKVAFTHIATGLRAQERRA